MEPALRPGDRIVIDKRCGNRPYDRIRRNDIVFFHFPCRDDWMQIEKQHRKYYVKRCIGMPGETLSIRNGFYRIEGCNKPAGYLPEQVLLSNLSDSEIPGEVIKAFPFDTLSGWTIRNFGPLRLPASGDTLPASRDNFKLYGRYIAYETHSRVVFADSLFHIGNDTVSRYVFRSNYYFMAGDRATDSQDSRYWGLLPEECIIGKAVLILYSADPRTGALSTGRMFRTLN